MPSSLLLRLRLTGAALVLAVAVAAGPAAQPARHSHDALPDHAGSYTIKAGPNGTFVCQPAEPSDEAVVRQRSGRPVNLTALPSLNPPELLGGLRIVLRATDQLLERPDALLAFRRAAARWERAITTPITIVYDIDYGPTRFGDSEYPPGVIASANSASGFAIENGRLATPADVLARMRSRTSAPDLQALYDAIPRPLPSTVTNEDGDSAPIQFVYAGQPTLQMLGYLPASLDPDPEVSPFGDVPNLGFNSALDFDFDPNDGIDANLIDFEAIVIHEMGHSLGFTSAIGFADQRTNAQLGGVLATPWDFFRVHPDAVEPGESYTDGAGWETAPRVVTPGPPYEETFEQGGEEYFFAVQTFFDGTAEYETSTATGAGAGGDGQQASHWRDDAYRPPDPLDSGDQYIGIMDPNFGAGVRQLYKYPDLRVLEVLGYGIDYDPTYASGVQLSIGGAAVDVSGFEVAPVSLGDIDAGATREVAITLANPDPLVGLAFDVELIEEVTLPSGTVVSATFGESEGTADAGGTATVTLTIGADAPAFFSGVLRFRTNVAESLVIEVPIEFSVGGASEPELVLAGVPEEGDFGDQGDLDEGEVATVAFELQNAGSLPLEFAVLTQLTTRSFPFSTEPDAESRIAGQGSRSALGRFFGARAVEADVRYAFDFEDQAAFDALPKGGSVPGDWQLVSGGAAALGGHSATRAGYFGQITPGEDGDIYEYRDQATGLLLLPEVDLSDVGPEDLAVVTFNYYLQAEEGYDFAEVVFTVDGGQTYETVASSDMGVLQNTPDGWTSVMIDVSALTGLDAPVRFGFQFVSDQSVNAEGWYIDDVEVAVLGGENPFFASPRTGEIEGNGSVSVSVSAVGANLATGFYEGVVEVLSSQRAEDPDPFRLSFSAGDPQGPTLVSDITSIQTSVAEGRSETVELVVTNEGAAPLTFVRVLEPALSQYQADEPPGQASLPAFSTDAFASNGAGPVTVTAGVPGSAASTVDGEASVELPTTFALGITHLPDGRVVVSEVGSSDSVPRTFVLSEDLSTVETFEGVTPAGVQILAVAYNDQTGTLWYAGFQSGALHEVAFDGTGLRLTGRTVGLGFQIASLDYSSALDAFLIVPYNSNVVTAFDVEGSPLPGYPNQFYRGSLYSGLSITGGVVEIGYLDLDNSPADSPQISYVLYDQFQNLFAGNAGSPIVVIDDPDVTAARSVRAFKRSLTDPDGTMYLLTRGSEGLNARVVTIDPPDLPEATQTFVAATEPAYFNDLAPGASTSQTFTVAPAGESGTVASDAVVFLTNAPVERVVQIPVEASVTGGVATEDAVPAAFGITGVRPNPARGTARVSFGLAEAAEVTAEVYDALGRRVAVLASAEALAAGTHELDLPTAALAPGVYVVRVVAGADVASQKVTIIR